MKPTLFSMLYFSPHAECIAYIKIGVITYTAVNKSEHIVSLLD